MATRRATHFPGAMSEDVAFGKHRSEARPSPLRVDGSFAFAVLLSLLLLVPAVAVGWNIGKVGGVAGFVMAVVAGGLVSIAVSFLAARAWLRFATGDRIFADATLAGWIRRSRAERQVAVAREVFDDPEVASIELHVERLIGYSKAIEARDARTHKHSSRVAVHATSCAKHLGLDHDSMSRLRAAAKLHDIGALNEAVWLDPTDDEKLAVALAGADLVAFTGDRRLISALRHQHENFDGTGSPDGLAGDAIPLAARIIAVADVYDMVSRDRGQAAALAELNAGAGSRFDPDVVEAFNTDAQASPISALRGAAAGIAPKASAGIVDVLRGSATVAAAASVATGAVVATGVGGPPPEKHTPSGSNAGAAAAVVAAPLAESTKVDDRVTSRKKKSNGAGRTNSSDKNSNGNGGDRAPKSQTGNGRNESGHESKSDASPGSSAPDKQESKPVAPVEQIADDLGETVDDTVGTVDKVANDVVETVDKVVTDTVETVDGVVGGVVGKKK